VNNLHNYHYSTQITQQTKLRVAPVALVVSSVSSRAVWQARHSQTAWARRIERVECVVSIRDEPSGIWAYKSLIQEKSSYWKLNLTPHT